MTKPEQAVEMMAKGYACSQAVLAAFAADYGLDRDQAMTPAEPSLAARTRERDPGRALGSVVP